MRAHVCEASPSSQMQYACWSRFTASTDPRGFAAYADKSAASRPRTHEHQSLQQLPLVAEAPERAAVGVRAAQCRRPQFFAARTAGGRRRQ